MRKCAFFCCRFPNPPTQSLSFRLLGTDNTRYLNCVLHAWSSYRTRMSTFMWCDNAKPLNKVLQGNAFKWQQVITQQCTWAYPYGVMWKNERAWGFCVINVCHPILHHQCSLRNTFTNMVLVAHLIYCPFKSGFLIRVYLLVNWVSDYIRIPNKKFGWLFIWCGIKRFYTTWYQNDMRVNFQTPM